MAGAGSFSVCVDSSRIKVTVYSSLCSSIVDIDLSLPTDFRGEVETLSQLTYTIFTYMYSDVYVSLLINIVSLSNPPILIN